AALAKDIRNTCNIKDTKYSPLERMVSDMVRVVSVNNQLQIIAVDKFDKQSEEGGTIKTFTVGKTVGSIDLAVSKVMLSEILEGIGNTGLSDITFSQKETNLIINHTKGEYSLVGLNSDELITLFHPDEVTEPAPVIDITEGDNYILPTTQKVQLIETTVNNVIYCEVVEVEVTEVAEVAEVELSDILGIDIIDSQLYAVITVDDVNIDDLLDELDEIKPVNQIDNVKIIHVSDKITDITKSVIQTETIKFQQQITPIGDTKKGYTQSRFLIKTTEGIKEKTGFIKGQIAISQELNCDSFTHLPSGLLIANLNKKNIFFNDTEPNRNVTKKDVKLRGEKLVDVLNSLDFISKSELTYLDEAIMFIHISSITGARTIEDVLEKVLRRLEDKDEHNLINPLKAHFNIIDF
ncbi:MAG TPA: hypothetical protein V6C58_24860, partial [Allocoleopsis sp.]